MKIALITGASSGLGAEFTRTIIGKYDDLDEIWLVARRKERLDAFAEQYPQTRFRALALDLSSPEAWEELKAQLAQETPNIRVLVNNAGLERHGQLTSMPLKDMIDVIGVNVIGSTVVSRLCLPYMFPGSVEVITCSTSSFAPVPGQAVYSASKAFVRFMGLALHQEMKSRGVHVCTLCPGNMDTEMNRREDAGNTGVGKLPYLDMATITDKALDKAERGSALYTPGAFYKFYQIAGKVFPANWIMHFSGGYFEE